MTFFKGIVYNIKGLWIGLSTPRLLVLGLLRFVITALLALFLAGMVLVRHARILEMIWARPDDGWVIFLWTLVSWLLSLFLAMMAMLGSYLIAQVLFCVILMDLMSRYTEEMVSGRVRVPQGESRPLQAFFFLVIQEIPRAVVPLILMLILTVAGFLTPFGPVVAALSAVTAGIFLAWDNTDLVAARRMVPFRSRLSFLKQHLGFHLGFGICFLIPWLNILLLSFAPVGATLYVLESQDVTPVPGEKNGT